jgi:3-oxoacyl-[acyl-carrier-protein] synthase II
MSELSVNGNGKRVVVTGIGAVAPNGPDTASYWNSLLNGVSGVRKIRAFDVSDYPCRIGGEAVDFQPEKYLDQRTIRRTGRAAHLAVASVRLAFQSSFPDTGPPETDEVSVIFGAGCPPIDVIAADVGRFTIKGARGLEAFRLSAEDTNSLAAAVRESLGASELAIVIASGCTAGLNAVGLAADRIRQRQSKIVVCGSADAPLSPFSYAVFCASGIMTKANSNPEKASRPFDLKRDGGVLSEGAGALILEPLEAARARQAPIYGEILGFGSVSQRPQTNGRLADESAREGFIRSMSLAIGDAHFTAADVDYICAHAPSDPEFDRIETEAIKAVFGERAYRIPVSSIKSCIGNPISAAGVLQTIVALLAIRDGKIPPTINYEHPDPSCDLDCVPNTWRYNTTDVALINSHGMGGTYSSLLIGRYPERI